MAAPLAPIAYTALRFGAVAAVGWYLRSRHRQAPKHVWREAALNDANDGIEVTTQRNEREANAHGAARFRRTIRFGPGGRGVEIDATALGRIRLRRTD